MPDAFRESLCTQPGDAQTKNNYCDHAGYMKLLCHQVSDKRRQQGEANGHQAILPYRPQSESEHFACQQAYQHTAANQYQEY